MSDVWQNARGPHAVASACYSWADVTAEYMLPKQLGNSVQPSMWRMQ